MKKAAVFATVLGALIGPAHGQISLGPNQRPLLTADQLVAVVGSDSAAGEIISRALAFQVRVQHTESIVVIGSQIPENWIPAIPGVQFLRVGDAAARTHFEGCGVLWVVESFTRVADDAVSIGIAKRTKCSSSGLWLQFNGTADGWHRKEGAGSGFGSGTEHCGCMV
jgi:hypothetical protein